VKILQYFLIKKFEGLKEHIDLYSFSCLGD
jgi:hypothetical protein